MLKYLSLIFRKIISLFSFKKKAAANKKKKVRRSVDNLPPENIYPLW